MDFDIILKYVNKLLYKSLYIFKIVKRYWFRNQNENFDFLLFSYKFIKI